MITTCRSVPITFGLNQLQYIDFMTVIFPIPGLGMWLAGQQKFIVSAYPIDRHICTVMNPIQRRDEGRGLWQLPGQSGPIQHVSIVLNTIHMTACGHNSQSSPRFKRLTATATLVLFLPPDKHKPVSSLQMSEDTWMWQVLWARGCSTDRWYCQPAKV